MVFTVFLNSGFSLTLQAQGPQGSSATRPVTHWGPCCVLLLATWQQVPPPPTTLMIIIDLSTNSAGLTAAAFNGRSKQEQQEQQEQQSSRSSRNVHVPNPISPLPGPP